MIHYPDRLLSTIAGHVHEPVSDAGARGARESHGAAGCEPLPLKCRVAACAAPSRGASV